MKCNLHHKHATHYKMRRQLRDYCFEDCMSAAYLVECGREREEGSFGNKVEVPVLCNRVSSAVTQTNLVPSR